MKFIFYGENGEKIGEELCYATVKFNMEDLAEYLMHYFQAKNYIIT